MEDKELLELAAKAAELELIDWRDNWSEYGPGWRYEQSDGMRECWNPLTDDGDALRLAVKLGIEFHMVGDEGSECVWANEIFEWTDGCALSATRRAITRAAAQIGKEME